MTSFLGKKINVALLGCGMMGQEHISYMQGYQDIQLLFLCDPCQSSLDKALSMIHPSSPPPRTFDCEKSMFQDADVQAKVDLLVIATPNYLHTPQLLRWAQRPISILVEKPVAISERQVAALRAAAPAFQADIWVAMEYRYIPAIQKLIQLLPQIGPLKKVAIRENRYPFLRKIGEWNKDIDKSGDTLVEKCCHFFDLFRLISGCEMKRCTSMVHRGLNFDDYGYSARTDNPVPIIDGAYVLLDLAKPQTSSSHYEDYGYNEEKDPEPSKQQDSGTLGCLELCMFAEGSRHQEEIVVTGLEGRLEAYLPENKVFFYKRPTLEDWPDRSIPPPRGAIKETIIDCSNLLNVYDFADEIPKHKGYHYCSTAIEWKHLIDQIQAKRNPDIGRFTPQVSLDDGIRAVEMGIAAMNHIANDDSSTDQELIHTPWQTRLPRRIYPIVACTSISSENLLNLALMNNLTLMSSQEGIKPPSTVVEEP